MHTTAAAAALAATSSRSCSRTQQQPHARQLQQRAATQQHSTPRSSSSAAQQQRLASAESVAESSCKSASARQRRAAGCYCCGVAAHHESPEGIWSLEKHVEVLQLNATSITMARCRSACGDARRQQQQVRHTVRCACASDRRVRSSTESAGHVASVGGDCVTADAVAKLCLTAERWAYENYYY